MEAQIPQLRPEHESLIHDEGDVHLLEICYGLPEEILTEIASTYQPKSLKRYNMVQSKWLAEEKWLVGARTKHDPTVDEQLADLDHEHLLLRFRVYYALSHPDDVKRAD